MNAQSSFVSPLSSDFHQRLSRVQTAINNGLKNVNPTDMNAIRARQWVRWMDKNLLDNKGVKA